MLESQQELLQHIQSLEQLLLQPYSKEDRVGLSDIIHNDFEEVGSSGRVISKDEAVDWLTRSEDTIQWTMNDFRIRKLASDLVMAHYTAHSHDQISGTVVKSMRSSLWKRSGDGNWQIIFHQGSKIIPK